MYDDIMISGCHQLLLHEVKYVRYVHETVECAEKNDETFERYFVSAVQPKLVLINW